jgi:hypothetical protein
MNVLVAAQDIRAALESVNEANLNSVASMKLLEGLPEVVS